MIFIAVIFHFCNLNYEFEKTKMDTIKCPKFHEDFKYGTSYEDISKFKNKYNIIDIRYTHYLDTTWSSNYW